MKKAPISLLPASEGGGESLTFTEALNAAWAGDYVLNWTGGNVTLSAPVLLQAFANKYHFGIRGNGATLTCSFADATKAAITMEVPIVTGSVLQNISVRNWQITDLSFVGTSAFAGAIEVRCLTNGSWFYSFLMSNIQCETHSDFAFKWKGSVFECAGDDLKSTGGNGGFWAERADNGNGDFGLPSAMALNRPNFRDGLTTGVELVCLATSYGTTEPFDLTIKGGYIVGMGRWGMSAPSGITLVENVGFESIQGGYGIMLGYRGGVIKSGTRGANPVPNATEELGMRYLVRWWGATGKLVLEDIGYENEGSGSGMTLAKTGGSGTVYLNRIGDETVVDNDGCTIVVQSE